MADVQIFIDLALLLLSAKVFGEIADRFGMSTLVGEVFGGILVGPLLGLVHPNLLLSQIAGFGILFLLFIIGLHTNFEEVKKDVYAGSVLAIAGIALSVLSGFLVGYFLFNSIQIGIFLGIAILSTSTAMTLRSLIDAGESQSRAYRMSLAIDLADEVLAILALSLLTTYFTIGSVRPWDVITLFLAVLGFILVIITVGAKAVGRSLTVFQRMRDEQILISIPLAIVFVIAFISEHVGIAGVTGAFLAGMAMSRSQLTQPIIVPKMKVIAYGFFVPVFFAYSALVLDIGALVTYAPIVLLLLVAGSLAKVIGCGLVSRFYGFNSHEQKVVGIGMIPRGEYSIIIAQFALTAGIIKNDLYTIVIAFVVLSILVTPLLLRLASKKGFR